MTHDEAKEAMASGAVVATKHHTKFFPKNYMFVIKNLSEHGGTWWTFPKPYQKLQKNPIVGIGQLKIVNDDLQIKYQAEKMKAEIGLK